MENYCSLAEKYQIRAPLIALAPGLQIKDYIRVCASLGMTAKLTELVSHLAAACLKNEESITSIECVSQSATKRSPNTIRAHLKTLIEAGLCQSSFITTDPIRHRRGTLFTLCMPEANSLAKQLSNDPMDTPSESKELVVRNALEAKTAVSEEQHSFASTVVARYLVKAMRTNRKDKRTMLSIAFTAPNGEKLDIASEAEGGRLMAVPDLAYYSGALTWLLAHFAILSAEGKEEPTTETYHIPLHQLVVLSKKASMSDATSKGYGNAAIEGIRRISSTTFNVEDIPSAQRKWLNNEHVFIKLFRLERIAYYHESEKSRRRLVTIQFPVSTVQACWAAVAENRQYSELITIDEMLLQSKNEIEILFGLWAKDIIRTGQSMFVRRSLNWNELRELVAPNSKLSEFKRKFTSFVIENRDESYTPSKVSEERRKLLTQIHDNIWVSENRKREYVVEYGKATAHGFIINVGYVEEVGQTLISLRQEVSGLAIKFEHDFKVRT